ncbi:glycosyltransferase family 32 protein [Pedobacter paludis]|uniref:Glycosyl transferase n=1 Tax=Pedobacter paludis TaxID=2203212 RepID=A0A317EXJ4_9SPHI|nr:glycosyltransferase [Pedobacter paludis]PWS31680.1 glycosyl transferase [Pedobacter paludis]
MIPKIIHYCWFGNNDFDPLIKKCISSWERELPDYQIIKWDENNFDILNSNTFVKKAFELKKWAFVSDFVRAYALYNYGGIYLDTDVEIKHSLNRFLNHSAFSGFEQTGAPFTALWASEKKHPWPEAVLNYYYDQMEFSLKTNTKIVSEILIDKYKVDPNKNATQYLDDGIVIYSSDVFCVDITLNFACHHFNCSWVEDGEHPIPFKDALNLDYYKEKYLEAIKVSKIVADKELVKYVKSKYLFAELFKRLKNKMKLTK